MDMLNLRLLVALIALTSGCMGLPPSEDEMGLALSSTLRVENLCLSGHTVCQETQSGWVIHDIQVSNPHQEATGLDLTALSKPLTIRNVTVIGFPTGVYMGAGCASCTVEMHDVSLVGGPGGAAGVDYRAIEQSESRFHFAAKGLQIDGFDRAIGWFGGVGDRVHIQDLHVACGLEGLVISAGSIDLHRVEVTGCDGSGARLKGYTAAALVNSSFLENGQGASLFGQEFSQARVQESLFESNGVGGLIVGAPGVHLQGNVFRGNGGAAAWPETAVEAGRAHALYLDAKPSDMVDNCFEQNMGWAISGALDVLPVSSSGNRWAGLLGPIQGTPSGDELDRPRQVPGLQEEYLDVGVTVHRPLTVDRCD